MSLDPGPLGRPARNVSFVLQTCRERARNVPRTNANLMYERRLGDAAKSRADARRENIGTRVHARRKWERFSLRTSFRACSDTGPEASRLSSSRLSRETFPLVPERREGREKIKKRPAGCVFTSDPRFSCSSSTCRATYVRVSSMGPRVPGICRFNEG